MSKMSELDSDRQQVERLTDVVPPPSFAESARAGAAEHTPTPWRAEENCLGVYPISAKHGPLTVQPAKAFSEGDAAFIVKAVNNHDALVVALSEAAERLDARGHKFGAEQARAVIAQAKAEA